LYGKAFLITNRWFNKRTFSNQDYSINYKLPNSDEVRSSGSSDTGIEVSNEVLRQLGY